MTLKSDTRPASSSSGSGASGAGSGGGGGGGKHRAAVRPTGFSSNEEDYKYVAVSAEIHMICAVGVPDVSSFSRNRDVAVRGMLAVRVENFS